MSLPQLPSVVSRRRAWPILLALLALGGGLLAVMASGRLDPVRMQLRATADALAARTNWVVSGSQTTDFTGPGVPINEKLDFQAHYVGPDTFVYEIRLPQINAVGATRFGTYRSLTIADRYWTSDDIDSSNWRVSDQPVNNGLDLESVRLLPAFLRSARDLAMTTTADGRVITGIGDARNWPSVIFHGFLGQTAVDVPFTLTVDVATNLPKLLVAHPRQWPAVVPGQLLRHWTTLSFTAFVSDAAVPLPSPLVTAAPILRDPGPGVLIPGPSANPRATTGPTPGLTATPDPQTAPAISQPPLANPPTRAPLPTDLPPAGSPGH